MNRFLSEKFFLPGRYMQFTRQAKSRHSVHSPYIYKLIEDVIRPGAPHAICSRVEDLRNELLKDHRVILKTDYGSGSNDLSPAQYPAKVSRLARQSSLPSRRASRLFALVRFLNASSILELGTALGLSAAYMAEANRKARVLTLEGCPMLAALARQNIGRLGLDNVQVLQGEFDRLLPEALGMISPPDLVFIDGNHRREPTLNYFRMILPHSHENTVLVFDDIHSSREMEMAWREIMGHPEVTVSIDLFHQGWVLFKKELSHQHFTLRYP